MVLLSLDVEKLLVERKVTSNRSLRQRNIKCTDSIHDVDSQVVRTKKLIGQDRMAVGKSPTKCLVDREQGKSVLLRKRAGMKGTKRKDTRKGMVSQGGRFRFKSERENVPKIA